jgi:YidC/Oxa1 family membrane protein insertase
MNRQTLIGIVLIFAIFFISEQFIWKKSKTPQPTTVKQEQTQPTQTPVTETNPVNSAVLPPEFNMANAQVAEINDNIILENDSLKIVFSNKGAVIREVFLKKFLLTDKSIVQLIPAGKAIANTILLGESSSTDLVNIPFQYESIVENGFNGVRFFFSPESDKIIEKKYVLGYNYGVNHKLTIHSSGALKGYSIDFGAGINDTEEYVKTKAQDYRFYTQADNTIIIKDLSKLKKNSFLQNGKVEWAAIRSKYFVLACKDEAPVLTNSVKADTSSQSPAFTMTTKRENASNDWEEDFLLYMGPSSYDLLKSHGGGLENVSERGYKWLRWLVDIFAWFLSFLYKLIPNYGVVILVFSIVIKIVLHPLSHKSMDAMRKTQKIQPQVQAIQAQYKSDPKRMQQELSKLYKETGASPLGGCLPMLFQMPVFFALYTVLRFSLDMRQAHFVGWLKDLSEPDPYYILPILMGVFMIVQQLMMNPKKEQVEQMDEKQQAMQQSQKMMAYIMPVILFFVFKSMPAGLVLYWTVFNVLSIIQQYYLQKHLSKKETQ